MIDRTPIASPLTLEGFTEALGASGIELGLMEAEAEGGLKPSYIYGHLVDSSMGGPLVDVETEAPPKYAAFLDYVRLAVIPRACLVAGSRLRYTRDEFVSLALASWIAIRLRNNPPDLDSYPDGVVSLLPSAQFMDRAGVVRELDDDFMVRLWVSIEWHQTQNPWFPEKEAP